MLCAWREMGAKLPSLSQMWQNISFQAGTKVLSSMLGTVNSQDNDSQETYSFLIIRFLCFMLALLGSRFESVETFGARSKPS